MAKSEDPGAWFAAKRYGYGAGWPIAWQGWALLGGYLAAVLAVGRILGEHSAVGLAVILGATAVVIVLSARHTRGGWRWRWGADA